MRREYDEPEGTAGERTGKRVSRHVYQWSYSHVARYDRAASVTYGDFVSAPVCVVMGPDVAG